MPNPDILSDIVVWAPSQATNNGLTIGRDYFRSRQGLGQHEFWDTTWMYSQEATLNGPWEETYGYLNVSSDGSADAEALLEFFQGMGSIVSEAMGPSMHSYIVQLPVFPGVANAATSISIAELSGILSQMTYKLMANNIDYGTSRGGANVNGKVQLRADTLTNYTQHYETNGAPPAGPMYTAHAYLYLHELAHSSPPGQALNAQYGALHYSQFGNYNTYDISSPHFVAHEQAVYQIAVAIGSVIGIIIPSNPPWTVGP